MTNNSIDAREVNARADLITLLGWHERRPVSTRDGGEYADPCPRCGGTDRFHVWPNGANGPHFKCLGREEGRNGCGWHGDAISILMDAEGMSFPQACDVTAGGRPAGTQAPRIPPPMPPVRHSRVTVADLEDYPAEASKMMQAGGYTPDNPLVAEMPSYYFRAGRPQLVVPGINQSLPEVDISFREVDNPTHVTLMSDRNFDEMIGFLWGPPGYSMDQWIYPFCHSTGRLNYGSVSDPELDTMLVNQRASTDLAEKEEIWQQIYDRIHNMVYQAWFPEAQNRSVWHNYS